MSIIHIKTTQSCIKKSYINLYFIETSHKHMQNVRTSAVSTDSDSIQAEPMNTIDNQVDRQE